MINMTDRYTISAPVAVNAGLFAKLHAHSSGRTSEEEGRTSGEADRPLSPLGSPQRHHHHHPHAAGMWWILRFF
jgi:hypothetical protein